MHRSGVALVLAILTLHAQSRMGEVRVQVKDPSGAAMEASGKLKNLAIGGERSFKTDPQGEFTFANLPFGRYRLEVSKTGFATQSELIDVQSATPVLRTVTMALGTQTAQVDVVATTPLRGVDLPLNEIPAPVQTATQADIQDSAALDLADFMNRRLNGVYVNEMQDNPFQPDVNYRGYTASPLLGTPEGLSVYRGRRAAKSAVRRCGELGPDPAQCDFGDDADAGIESGIRTQYAGRLDFGHHQGRRQLSGA